MVISRAASPRCPALGTVFARVRGGLGELASFVPAVTRHAPFEDVAAVRDAGADRYVTDRRRLQCG
ncbi:hypothetical protein G3I59_24985 [Amycolatopsis rubida]|uniref:Glycerophosphoryl diester phosphodiesterase n=1 Tax=Amycolatopsis rubida TaxID=112413 RepID=A0ABX0C1E5_9PSEU|nr:MULTISPECIES: hypothetical protein [Amycolatopsis]MYW93779.1 hypothetical protein [Amycolatopsis rubida]NEC58768.1 hypothetical protein [Amycolatopsis rubida]OAP22964.1 hypothetical protein A4R44_06426 [Amycolatopsis sp. M39]